MLKRGRTWTKRRSAAALVLASSSMLAGYKAHEYSADPTGEKHCPPLVAETASSSDTLLAAQPEPAAGATPRTSTGAATEAPFAGDLPWSQKGGIINDVSCLNQTRVYGVVQVSSEEDIRKALQFAQANRLKVSIAGVRHSMGGQAFFKNALVLDMTQFNSMRFDEPSKVLTVQSGATWHAIQNLLHPKYAVKAMQSTDIFTVGGSISVNAHGMDHHAGTVGRTIRSMRVMLPDGSIQRASRTENAELFKLVVGGYGLFGIVLDVDLDVTPNVVYASGRQIIDYQAFPNLFDSALANDTQIGLMYAHLSTAPQSLLQEMILYTYTATDAPDANVPPLGEVAHTRLRRFVINFSKRGSIPMRLKWFTEKYIEPHVESCTVTRNQAMKDGEACLVSRNEPMHDSVAYLKNNLKNDTDILQEYFVPRDQLVAFIDGLRQIVRDNETNVLNASVRVVHHEDNVLSYASADMFAVVLYINQPTTPEGNQRMASTTRRIVDLALQHRGTFFLPYQLYYTPDQLRQAYPMIDAFFDAKQRYDPQLTLTNTFYER
ncbi:MAG: FAD-binding oxidoreductase, partial [Chloroflexi bacterium]